DAGPSAFLRDAVPVLPQNIVLHLVVAVRAKEANPIVAVSPIALAIVEVGVADLVAVRIFHIDWIRFFHVRSVVGLDPLKPTVHTPINVNVWRAARVAGPPQFELLHRSLLCPAAELPQAGAERGFEG